MFICGITLTPRSVSTSTITIVLLGQMRSQALPNVASVARVGDYRSPQGGSMVYYAVDANGQSVGYIVYLGQDGKVLKIE